MSLLGACRLVKFAAASPLVARENKLTVLVELLAANRKRNYAGNYFEAIRESG
jgi:hypothetical protein